MQETTHTTQDDERFMDLLDGRLPEAEAEALRQALRGDPGLGQAWDGYKDIVGSLRKLPVEEAPPEFLRLVQQRIRRKTRGRFYGPLPGASGFPYQAAVSVVLLAIMMAIYLLGHPTEETPRLVDPSVLRALPAGMADTVALAGGTMNGATKRCDGRHEITLPAGQVDAVARRFASEVMLEPVTGTDPVKLCVAPR